MSDHHLTYLPHLAELRARRLIAQGLAYSAARPMVASAPVDVARHMIALQGQNYDAGVRALAVRVKEAASSRSDADTDPLQDATESALNSIADFEIVRCWPQRGTLHFLPSENARWMMQLTHPRIEAQAARRRAGLGFEPGDYERALEAFVDMLNKRGVSDPVSRPEAYDVFAAADVDPSQGRGPHLLRAFGGAGEIVQGPRIGKVETFVSLTAIEQEKGISQRELTGDDALQVLGTEYFHARGPATLKDLMWWTGITKKQAVTAVETASDLIPFAFHGDTYWMGSWQADVTAAELTAALDRELSLPAFDEYLLGYGSRVEVLSDELRPEVLTKNGISWPFEVRNGVIVGRSKK
ncbi:winged helix DNA-binding domain-containing protein [Corynebacterium sp. H78]|uniref:winged helix DNA-binding domain-containing protein n=1 Tax=Corynebacterium sp. H78 TaxID=3133417 RepID=UPI0030B52448